MPRRKEEKVNWTFDYKKVRILHYLFANPQGGIRSTFLQLRHKRNYGIISSSQIDSLLLELRIDELIVEHRITSTNTSYTISDKGRGFIVGLKKLAEDHQCKLYIIDALDEPVDMVTSRDDSLR
jgi:hypothetical protein